MSKQHVTIIGAGSWGTAMAIHLARSGSNVYLVSNSIEHAKEMQTSRENLKYLPRATLPDNITITVNLSMAVSRSNVVMIMTPSKAFVSCIEAIAPDLLADSLLCWGCKGVVSFNNQIVFFDQVVKSKLGLNQQYAVIGGPSFATEVAQASPTAIVVAAEKEAVAQRLSSLLHHGIMRCYSSKDVVGVELCGVLKNILAVAAGISDGLGLGANTRSALITRGLAEMQRLGSVLGVDPETLMGLAGVGDVILSCTSDLSRNRRLGLGLGRGQSVSDVVKEIGQVVESLVNIDVVLNLAHKEKVSLPITEQVSYVVKGKLSPKEAMNELLARSSKPEFCD